jgi:hypothetical protein
MSAARKMFSDGGDCARAAPEARSNGRACRSVAPKGENLDGRRPKKASQLQKFMAKK